MFLHGHAFITVPVERFRHNVKCASVYNFHFTSTASTYCMQNSILTFHIIISQLLEFRNVLAKVIGLEIESTPVPDYEIISRLEKLVEAHQVNARKFLEKKLQILNLLSFSFLRQIIGFYAILSIEMTAATLISDLILFKNV